MTIELIVLTLNCWGIPYVSKDRNIRMNAIADELNSGKYHIVTLQEVWSQSDFELIQQKTAQVLPYAHYFYSGVAGSGVCILSAFPIIDAFFHQWSINGYIHRIQHGDWFGGKGVGLCKIRTNDGTIINIYSAHLHAEYNRDCDDYLAHRVLQAFETGKFIALTSSDSDVSILGGDLNTEPTDLAYRIILGSSGLHDSFIPFQNDEITCRRSTGTNEHKENTYSPKSVSDSDIEGKRIDYILYKGSNKVKVNVSKYEHPLPVTIPNHDISFSDHEAVVTTFRLEKAFSTSETGKVCFIPDDTNNLEQNLNNSYAQDINDSIKICKEALISLDNHKRSYIYLSIVCFSLLLAIIKMSDLSSLTVTSTLILIVQISLTIIWMFGLLMAFMWNNIERNSVFAGKLSMEIHLKYLKDNGQ
ncbi:putative neutral sphingomyelinase [Ctenocephalides felis]|uniref:putative neutral sphingomyelinase n=1 Tax=Ctenocephalides felis TaxID=7515 RepID=UPI000E6E4C4A|nr:putative neutral sphingomyelinase [Ctenocephalides felis]